MKFLGECSKGKNQTVAKVSSYSLGTIWPESILCEILSNGASGPHVSALLGLGSNFAFQ